jgi:competence protein ComEC
MQNPFVFVIWITLAGFITRLGHRVFRIRWLIFFLIACIASLAVPMLKQSLEKPALTVTFFDVGQGDAALVRTTEGKTLLIDTGGLRGSQPAAALSIVPELLQQQIDTLDAVILTHDHLDHTAGLSTIQQKIGVRTLYVPPDARTDAFSKAMRGLFSKKAASHGTVVKTVAAGDILPLAPSVFAGVVAPLPSFVRERDKNMTSVGLLLVHGETRYLFTGDLPSEGETEIAHHFGTMLDVDVIKAAHHGSKYSSSPEWLAATTPRMVITSSAMENRYGHPHAEAVLRFRQTGGALFHTALHGTIRVIDNGLPEQLVVKTARGIDKKP